MSFDSLKYLCGEALYFGRVSDDMDRRVFITYLDEYMGDFVFDKNTPFYFSREGHDYDLPKDGGTACLKDFQIHVEELPLHNSPSVFGLHPNAEISYFTQRTNSLWDNLITLQPQTSSKTSSINESNVFHTLNEIRAKVPLLSLDLGSFDVTDIRQRILASKKLSSEPSLTPYDVVLLQELDRWNILCINMVLSMNLLKKALFGEVVMNDDLESLSVSISEGILPSTWRRFAPSTSMKLGSWIAHFTKRFDQYRRWISYAENTHNLRHIWLSGLQAPGSYLTALLQVSSRLNLWPLDKCSLFTQVTNLRYTDDLVTSDESCAKGNNGFLVYGLYLEGASWDYKNSELKVQDPKQLVTELPMVHVTATLNNTPISKDLYVAPVYMTPERSNAEGEGLVFEAYLTSRRHDSIWTLQGVALTLNLTE